MDNQDLFSQKANFFDRWAPNYDWLLTTIFYQAIHQRLLSYVTLPHPSQVLDLGCGTGRLLHRLANKFPDLQGTGVDLSPQMLKEARQNNQHHPRLIYTKGNAESLPFVHNQFDAVFNTISFLHYPHPQIVFSEVSRILRPQGQFFLADFTMGTMKSTRFSPGGINFYNTQQREKFAETVGLNCMGHYHLLPRVILSIFSPTSST
ncbi:class I SAM-dependent methyltransferase [Aphanothece sacrum]|nr:class I SAM-dependent methyltransferase [Aphanothece sacrum]GBF84022.1 methyltransferase [Aphanothece sacrum FPU3]